MGSLREQFGKECFVCTVVWGYLWLKCHITVSWHNQDEIEMTCASFLAEVETEVMALSITSQILTLHFCNKTFHWDASSCLMLCVFFFPVVV